MWKRVVVVGSVLGVIASFVAEAQSGCQDPTWWPLGTGMNKDVRAIAVMSNGLDLIAGGDFTIAGEEPANHVARWVSSQGMWMPLGTGTDGIVRAVQVLQSGIAIVGGDFSAAGDIAANRIARWDPTTQTWAAMGSGVGGTSSPGVYALAETPNGDLVVGGHFITAGGLPASRIARWQPTTGLWSKMGTGIGGAVYPPLTVYAVAAFPNGDIVAGGNFSKAGGVPVNGIALWKASTGNWEAMGQGIFGTVRALTMMPNDEVVAGGGFFKAGQYPTKCVSRWDKFGWGWQPIGTGMAGGTGEGPAVLSLSAVPNGDLVAGGSFLTAGGKSLISLARWSIATGEWEKVGPNNWGFTAVRSIAQRSNGDLVVGGSFAVFELNRIGLLGCDPAVCVADCDASGSLTIDDFVCFQVGFALNDPKADCNGDTELTIDDFLCFQTAYAVGC